MRRARTIRLRGWPIKLGLCVLLGVANAMTLTNSHLSPRNTSRPRRSATEYIILHTTEGSSKGSLSKLSNRGECHYMVDTDGRIYRIIENRRVAYHAGRSMWRGRTNLDSRSIGIEVVGFHNKDIARAQYKSLRELITELQRIYRINDDRVLTHSMVAYGKPNRWHKRSHRGRKRCGMVFALRSVRKELGLTSQPGYDPDVKAGRLTQADPELAKILYGPESLQNRAVKTYAAKSKDNVIAPGRTAWDIARDRYKSADTIYVFPKGTRKKGSEIRDFRTLPTGTRVVIGSSQADNAREMLLALGEDGDSAREIAGDEWNNAHTLYFIMRDKHLLVKRGDQLSDKEAKSLAKGTRMLVGYKLAGTVTAARPAFALCGPRWNDAETFYLFPDGRLIPGNRVNETQIPANARVFMKS